MICGPLEYIIVQIEYCLGRPTNFRLRPDNTQAGLTRGEIALGVCSMYEHVFRVERETQPEPYWTKALGWEAGGGARGVVGLNRPATMGKVSTLRRWSQVESLISSGMLCSMHLDA